VGCCGFPVSHEKYYHDFRLVELQSTFYRLPLEKTALRWRKEAPSHFEFTVKAWQAITHPVSSPTWRKVKPPPGRIGSRYGLLKPTRQNFEAWNKTLEICRLLHARMCVIQCPPQFGFTQKNVRNMETFFNGIDRNGLILAWEPRGNWIERPEEIRRVCKILDLVHCVDLLRIDPAYQNRIGYTRLHGLGRREVNYSYKYTNGDLDNLSKRVNMLGQKGVEQAYVMFNNISMFDDAKRFMYRNRILPE